MLIESLPRQYDRQKETFFKAVLELKNRTTEEETKTDGLILQTLQLVKNESEFKRELKDIA